MAGGFLLWLSSDVNSFKIQDVHYFPTLTSFL